jgi:hypothetical protein
MTPLRDPSDDRHVIGNLVALYMHIHNGHVR